MKISNYRYFFSSVYSYNNVKVGGVCLTFSQVMNSKSNLGEVA